LVATCKALDAEICLKDCGGVGESDSEITPCDGQSVDFIFYDFEEGEENIFGSYDELQEFLEGA
jgi:hypothetical protein